MKEQKKVNSLATLKRVLLSHFGERDVVE